MGLSANLIDGWRIALDTGIRLSDRELAELGARLPQSVIREALLAVLVDPHATMGMVTQWSRGFNREDIWMRIGRAWDDPRWHPDPDRFRMALGMLDRIGSPTACGLSAMILLLMDDRKAAQRMIRLALDGNPHEPEALQAKDAIGRDRRPAWADRNHPRFA